MASASYLLFVILQRDGKRADRQRLQAAGYKHQVKSRRNEIEDGSRTLRHDTGGQAIEEAVTGYKSQGVTARWKKED